MSILDDICAALDGRLAGLGGLPPIAYQNTKFDELPGSAHLRVGFSVTSRRPITTGALPQQRYQGLYQVVIAIPKGVGSGPALAYADSIMEAFDAATVISRGDVHLTIDYSEAGSFAANDAFMLLPVNIAWRIVSQ